MMRTNFVGPLSLSQRGLTVCVQSKVYIRMCMYSTCKYMECMYMFVSVLVCILLVC